MGRVRTAHTQYVRPIFAIWSFKSVDSGPGLGTGGQVADLTANTFLKSHQPKSAMFPVCVFRRELEGAGLGTGRQEATARILLRCSSPRGRLGHRST